MTFSSVKVESEKSLPFIEIMGIMQTYKSIVNNFKEIDSVNIKYWDNLNESNLYNAYDFFCFTVKFKNNNFPIQILIVSIENSKVASLEIRDMYLENIDKLIEPSKYALKTPCIIVFRSELSSVNPSSIAMAVFKSGIEYRKKFSRFLELVQIYSPKGFVNKPNAPQLKKTLQYEMRESNLSDFNSGLEIQYIDDIIKSHFFEII